MKFVNDAPLFKISRITGPKHNFLGLQFAEAPLIGEPAVERLSVSNAEKEHLLDSEIVYHVKLGLAEAHSFCKGSYWLEKIQYVPSDSQPVEVYKELAVEIIRRIESRE
jgi:hypothetical protein